MFLGGPGAHRILGGLYNDDQLFRIIVPRRFTLSRRHCHSLTPPGFSKTALIFNTEKRAEYSDADIAFVLRYRWPERFKDFASSDVALIDYSVMGGGLHEESGIDPLLMDDPTLSQYCHEKVYKDPVRRTGILVAFKTELEEARQHRAAMIEERCKDFEPHVLEYIFVARLYMAMSWEKTAASLKRRSKKSRGSLEPCEEFTGAAIKEIYQMHSGAKTRIFDECLMNKESVQRVMAAMPPEEKERHEKRSKFATNKPFLLNKILSKEPLECHLTPTKIASRGKRKKPQPVPQIVITDIDAAFEDHDGYEDAQPLDQSNGSEDVVDSRFLHTMLPYCGVKPPQTTY